MLVRPDSFKVSFRLGFSGFEARWLSENENERTKRSARIIRCDHCREAFQNTSRGIFFYVKWMIWRWCSGIVNRIRLSALTINENIKNMKRSPWLSRRSDASNSNFEGEGHGRLNGWAFIGVMRREEFHCDDTSWREISISLALPSWIALFGVKMNQSKADGWERRSEKDEKRIKIAIFQFHSPLTHAAVSTRKKFFLFFRSKKKTFKRRTL